ncbi:MAG: esterase-like activity of phytase family protein [Alphaproteobacteria bacterium]
MKITRAWLTGFITLGAASAALFLWADHTSAKKPSHLAPPQKIEIMAQPIVFDRDKPGETRFGKLEWLGTLALSSPSRNFGGYSGLVLDKTGAALLAISDKGTWLSARLTYRGGKIVKLSEGKIGSLPGRGNKPLSSKYYSDSESIVMARSGRLTGNAYISFERRHRIDVYPITKNGFAAPKRSLKLPARAKSAESNKGIEAIAILRAGPLKGAVLAFTEDTLDSRDNHIGWLIGGSAPGMVTLRRYGGFSITDLASLPGGDIIVLERRFRFSEGVKMRLRRIALRDVQAGATLDGEVLLEADSLLEIDNMEGLTVHRDARGRTILTLVSDNNYNRIFQRTLLMQFAIVE